MELIICSGCLVSKLTPLPLEATKANSHLVRFGPILSQLSPEEDSQVILLSHLQLCLQLVSVTVLNTCEYTVCAGFWKRKVQLCFLMTIFLVTNLKSPVK